MGARNDKGFNGRRGGRVGRGDVFFFFFLDCRALVSQFFGGNFDLSRGDFSPVAPLWFFGIVILVPLGITSKNNKKI